MTGLKNVLFQALGYTGGIHLVTEYLLTQWQKNNTISGELPIPASATTATFGSGSPVGVGKSPGDLNAAPGQVLWTLYSIDSNPGTEAVLTFAAALLPSLSGGGGGAGTSPSTPALPGGSGGYAAPLLALGVGYLVGKAA
jgi:hypothetical protein